MKTKLSLLVLSLVSLSQLAVARDFFSEAKRVTPVSKKEVPLVLRKTEDGKEELFRADGVDVEALAEAKANNDDEKINQLLEDAFKTGEKLAIDGNIDQDRATPAWRVRYYGWVGWYYWSSFYVVWYRPVVFYTVTWIIYW